ncbi:MAG: sulfotransferase [Cyanobacteria bacterium P01_F01_bin.86]
MRHFFIVGAQRSSTTWLYHMLQQHPQIKMAEPVRPEPKYFLQRDKSISAADYKDQYFRDLLPVVTILGEKSTSYIESEFAAQKISETFKDAKIVMMLRDPSHRALSNFRFSVENGLEIRSPEEVFLQKLPAPKLTGDFSTDPFDYLGRGQYEKYLGLYSKYFDQKNIHVLCKEKVTTKPEVLRELYAFLSVDESFVPDAFDTSRNSSEIGFEASADVYAFLSEFYAQTKVSLSAFIDTAHWN